MTLVLILAALVYASRFDFLLLGDGTVGVASDSLRVATVQEGGDEAGTAYVLRDPTGTMTIGFPLTNRGLLPLSVVEIQPDVEGADGAVRACHWQRLAVRGTSEGAAAPGVVEPFGVRLSAGLNQQLYLEAGFPESECSAADASRTVTHMLVQYEVLGVLPRQQRIPLALKVRTVLDPDDPVWVPVQD